jgi:hypothetical protein
MHQCQRPPELQAMICLALIWMVVCGIASLPPFFKERPEQILE